MLVFFCESSRHICTALSRLSWCCLCSSKTSLSVRHCLCWSCSIVESLRDLQASEKEFSSSAKDYLVDSLRQQAVDSETVTRQAMALRRSALWAAAWTLLA